MPTFEIIDRLSEKELEFITAFDSVAGEQITKLSRRIDVKVSSHNKIAVTQEVARLCALFFHLGAAYSDREWRE